MKKREMGTYVSLNLLLAIYSFSGFFSKNAAKQPFGSVKFCALYAGMILILGIYALGWQQILKRIPLTAAYANKAVTVVWGIVYGVTFFGEDISWMQIVGAIIIIAGVCLYVKADIGEINE